MAYLAFIPTATILPYAGAGAPEGWLVCDGQAVSRTTFASLYAALGGALSPFGQGDGSTTFNLPDLRGRFPRFDDNMGSHGIAGVTATGAAGRDTGRTHGSAQTQTTARNGLTNSSSSVSTSASGVSGSVGGSDGTHTHTMTSSTFAANSTFGSGSLGAVGLGGGTYGTTVTNSAHGHGFGLTAAGQSGTATAQTISGDAETRPINLAISAIIKI